MVAVEFDYLAVAALQLRSSCWLNALRRCWWRFINFEESEEQRVASCSSLVDLWGAVDGVFDVASNKVLNVGVAYSTLGGGSSLTLRGGVLATLRSGVLTILGGGALLKIAVHFWMAWTWCTLAWLVVGISCWIAFSSSPAAIRV